MFDIHSVIRLQVCDLFNCRNACAILTQVHVCSGDIDSMASNAIKILSDKSLKKKYRSQAFENAKKYDIKKIIPLYENIYDEAINIY